MRITVNIKEELAGEIKRIAKSKKRSVSSLVSEAVERYVREIKRREAGKKLLELAGKVYVAPDALEELERGRQDEDRF